MPVVEIILARTEITHEAFFYVFTAVSFLPSNIIECGKGRCIFIRGEKSHVELKVALSRDDVITNAMDETAKNLKQKSTLSATHHLRTTPRSNKSAKFAVSKLRRPNLSKNSFSVISLSFKAASHNTLRGIQALK